MPAPSRSIVRWTEKLRGKSPWEIGAAVAGKFHALAASALARRRALMVDPRRRTHDTAVIVSRIDAAQLDASRLDREVLLHLADMYIGHRFDLLGSGWVSCGYWSEAQGFEGHRYSMSIKPCTVDREGEWLGDVVGSRHLRESKRLWRMCGGGYQPIDWQKDHKSGYRFSAAAWSRDIHAAPAPGVDIKFPWELSRLQHLPQLAAFALAHEAVRDPAIEEFRNEVLDFLAANPPNMGVNWACTMDVAIRIANVLIAFDLFRQLDVGGRLDTGFCQVVAQSAVQHGEFIRANLERSATFTSNHYLADLAGLLFAASYLGGYEPARAWAEFAWAEIESEFRKQFYADGGNFESSTCYHRLAAEMVAYATALHLGVRGPETATSAPVAPWYSERLMRAALLTRRLTKPDGSICQFGDNDSGRFVRISPAGQLRSRDQALAFYQNLSPGSVAEQYWDESSLDHGPLLSVMSGIFPDVPWLRSADRFPLERTLVRALARGTGLDAVGDPDSACPPSGHPGNSSVGQYGWTTIITAAADAEVPLTDRLRMDCFPDSGYYTFSSTRLFLAICASPPGQNGNGGHSHGDKLAMELVLDGEHVFTDPGTYVYTAAREWRDRFRSVVSHNTPQVDGEEQNEWREDSRGVFSTADQSRCGLVWAAPAGLCLEVRFRGFIYRRHVDIGENEIVITDSGNKPFVVNFRPVRWYSNGYGRKHASAMIPGTWQGVPVALVTTAAPGQEKGGVS